MLPDQPDALPHRVPAMDHDWNIILQGPLRLPVKSGILLNFEGPVPVEIQPDLPYRHPGTTAQPLLYQLQLSGIILLHRTGVQTDHADTFPRITLLQGQQGFQAFAIDRREIKLLNSFFFSTLYNIF